jgi:hypothetical protein
MSGQPISQRGANPGATLVAIPDSEIGELSQFVAVQSGREPASVESHLRWFLLQNPARDPQVPLGCGLRSPAGELVGCILCVPQNFRYQQQTLTLMGSSSFYVDERYRGSGGLLFLKFSEFGRRWPLFGNSANADAARLWKARGGTPIPFSDHELFGVVHWGPVIEELLSRRGGGRLSRFAGRASSRVVGLAKRLKLEGSESADLFRLASAEEVMELPIHEPPAELTAKRDLQYICWRYYSNRDATVAVFAFRSKRFGAEVLVTVNQRLRGYREQIGTLNLLDIYPAVNPEVCASIVGALLEHYRNAVDAIVLRGHNQERQELFLRKGFVRRQFDAPNGWFLDKSGLLPTRSLYMVPADGDWLI